MKKITVLSALLLLGAMQLVSQVSPVYYVPGGFNITTGALNQFENSISVGTGGFNTSAAGSTIIEGVDYVQVLPGYEATSFTSGSAWLRTNENIPRIVSYHQNGFTNIPKFDRYEIGIGLPSSVQNQINTFIVNGAGGINPYDPSQIKVECAFTTIVGTTPSVFTRHGFYRASEISANYQTNSWQTTSSVPNYPFRIRFAPPIVGNWKARVKIYLNGNTTPDYLAYDFDFTVVSSSNKGHLSISNTSVKKFKYDDGTLFYGVGRNVAYAVNGSAFGCAGYPDAPSYEWKATPMEHKEHRNALRDVASNQCNFVRMRLDRSSVPIEETAYCDILNNPGPSASDLTNFSKNEKYMWEMDSSLLLCEIRDVKILLTILDNWDYAPNGAWPRNPYSVFGLNTRNSFFSDPSTFDIFKKRLYYIEARWGYSTSIAAWEVFNETEGMDGTDTQTSWDAATSDLVNKWICKFRNYMQTGVYPAHLVTNGIANNPGEPKPAVNWTQNAPFNFCLDFYTEHVYQNELAPDCTTPANTKYNAISKAAQEYANAYNNYWSVPANYYGANGPYGKPQLFGEFGTGLTEKIGNQETNYSRILQRRSSLTFHNQNWGSLFSNSLTTALQWWNWNIDPNEQGPQSITADQKANPFHRQYRALRQFVNKIDFNTLLLPDRNVSAPFWRSTTYPSIENEEDQTSVTTYWMRTAGKDIIYGWTKNTSANFMSDTYNSNFPVGTPHCYNGTPNIPTALVSENSLLTKVQGLLPNTVYDIKIYDTWDPNGNQIDFKTVITDPSGVLRFGLDMTTWAPTSTPQDVYPDYAFIAVRHEGSSRMSGTSTDSVYTENNVDSLSANENVHISAISGGININNDDKNSVETTTSNVSEMPIYYGDRVYPVPTANKLYVVLDKHWQSPELTIVNELGVETRKFLNGDKSIDTGDLANGFYILRVKDAKHEKRFKIVVEH